jgi:hypothetical protein
VCTSGTIFETIESLPCGKDEGGHLRPTQHVCYTHQDTFLGFEEFDLVTNVLERHKRGFSISPSRVRQDALTLALKNHADHPITLAWASHARDDFQATWFRGWLERWGWCISVRSSEGMEHQRRVLTWQQIERGFQLMQEWIAQKGAEVLTRVAADGVVTVFRRALGVQCWNMDETNCSCKPTDEPALGCKGSQYCATVGNSNKQSFTVLPSVSAGMLLQPCFSRTLSMS